MRELFILGAGGHGRVLAETARATGCALRGFFDDRTPAGSTVVGVAVRGRFEDALLVDRDAEFAIGVGDNRARRDWALRLAAAGLRSATLIHPSAVVASTATIAEGSYVGPLAVVQAGAAIGKHGIVNTAAIVDHDCRVGDWGHASANIVMGGGSSIGEGSLLAVGCTVLPGVTIGAWTDVGAGAVVTRNLGDFVVAFGVPARVRRART